MNYHSNLTCYVPDAPNSNINTPRINKKHVTSMDVEGCQKNVLKPKLTMFSEKGEGWVKLTLPIRTVSEANCTQFWRIKDRRHKLQQGKVAALLKPLREIISLPCNVALTRYAPRRLDKHDNLPMSLKWIVDAVCAIITGDYRPGRADDDDRITICYDQITYPSYGVEILITYT